MLRSVFKICLEISFKQNELVGSVRFRSVPFGSSSSSSRLLLVSVSLTLGFFSLCSHFLSLLPFAYKHTVNSVYDVVCKSRRFCNSHECILAKDSQARKNWQRGARIGTGTPQESRIACGRMRLSSFSNNKNDFIKMPFEHENGDQACRFMTGGIETL